MARKNYQYEKRQKELARKKKKEEKRQAKLEDKKLQSGDKLGESQENIEVVEK